MPSEMDMAQEHALIYEDWVHWFTDRYIDRRMSEENDIGAILHDLFLWEALTPIICGDPKLSTAELDVDSLLALLRRFNELRTKMNDELPSWAKNIVIDVEHMFVNRVCGRIECSWSEFHEDSYSCLPTSTNDASYVDCIWVARFADKLWNVLELFEERVAYMDDGWESSDEPWRIYTQLISEMNIDGLSYCSGTLASLVSEAAQIQYSIAHAGTETVCDIPVPKRVVATCEICGHEFHQGSRERYWTVDGHVFCNDDACVEKAIECGWLVRYIYNGCSWELTDASDDYIPCTPFDHEVMNKHFDEVYFDDLQKEYNYRPQVMRFTDSSGAYKDEQSGKFYVGLEMETDCDWTSYCSDFGVDLFRTAVKNRQWGQFYFMHDGSLSNGTEITTVPLEFGYAMEKFPFEMIHTVAKKHHIRSHNTTTCGLHIHVNNSALGADEVELQLTQAKIVLLFDRFYDKFRKFGRRDLRGARHYAMAPDCGIRPNDDSMVICDKLQKAKDHYRCINLCGDNTTEFRLWHGTLNPATIRATVDFTHAICLFCKDKTLQECYVLTWEDFIASIKEDYLESADTFEYIKQRHLA